MEKKPDPHNLGEIEIKFDERELPLDKFSVLLEQLYIEQTTKS